MRFRIYVSVLTVISPVREASLRCLPPPIGSETACSWSRPAPAQEDPHPLLLLLAVQDHLLVPGVAVVALPQDVHLVLQAVHLPAQARLDTPLSAEQSNTNRERRGLKEKGLYKYWMEPYITSKLHAKTKLTQPPRQREFEDSGHKAKEGDEGGLMQYYLKL